MVKPGTRAALTERDPAWTDVPGYEDLSRPELKAEAKAVLAAVMSGVNPQGVQVVSFKQPSAEELDHNFLWRIAKAVPERGRIGIFNRSHYEEIVALRVHPEWLEAAAQGQCRRPPAA